MRISIFWLIFIAHAILTFSCKLLVDAANVEKSQIKQEQANDDDDDPEDRVKVFGSQYVSKNFIESPGESSLSPEEIEKKKQSREKMVKDFTQRYPFAFKDPIKGESYTVSRHEADKKLVEFMVRYLKVDPSTLDPKKIDKYLDKWDPKSRRNDNGQKKLGFVEMFRYLYRKHISKIKSYYEKSEEINESDDYYAEDEDTDNDQEGNEKKKKSRKEVIDQIVQWKIDEGL